MMRAYLIFVVLAAGGYYAYQSYGEGKDLLYKAFEQAEKASNQTWTPQVEYYVGKAYYLRDNHPKAQEVLKELLTDYPTCQWAPKAYLHLGEAAETNMDWELAKSALAKYEELFPDGKEKEVVRQKLEMLKYKRGSSVAPFPTREDLQRQ